MKKKDGIIVVMIGLAMFAASLLFAGVSAVNAGLRLAYEPPQKKILCRVVWEKNGVKQYEPWQDDCQMVQGWVEDGNDRFPQYKFRLDKTEIQGNCIDKWFNKEDMKGCSNE